MSYYDENASAYFDRTVNVDMSHLYEIFLGRLKPGAHILDAGCGSGRDTKAFLDRGYRVTAFDASPEMCRLASAYTGINVLPMTFNHVDWTSEFDGIWACASLLHVPLSETEAIWGKCVRALKPGGIWYFSYKAGNGEQIIDGRHYTFFSANEVQERLSQLGEIQIADVWVTQDQLANRQQRWINVLAIENASF